MRFIADIHLHSKFSRATAKNLDLENIYIAAQLKGINLVGTGDFTHPGWFSEIREKLVPAEPGLFKLREEIARQCDRQIPHSCRGEVRFILQCEISNIYKKNGKTRKNHHVIFVPDLETASALNAKLDAIGNIKSDGRPILGLDAKTLLKILLDGSSESFLIPAHIWTPWFSVLGSKSGFDSLAECFEELLPEIFAAETGLSSDPPMNWRISGLDNITLVSNSDAHSPANLGRNANIFDTELCYFAVKSALKTGDPSQCLGTIDMYPEEGKYHFDGHRKCNICFHPRETMSKNGLCPVCGKPLTIGVLYRVEELADRADGVKPEKALPFYHIIPLPEMLSEIFSVGPGSKKVLAHYQAVLETLGSEMHILLDCLPNRIDDAGIPLLSEAVRRMRAGEIHISPGYDGEYGKITVFEQKEKERLLGQRVLFEEVRGKRKHPPCPPSKGDFDVSALNLMPQGAESNAIKLSKKSPLEGGAGGCLCGNISHVPLQTGSLKHPLCPPSKGEFDVSALNLIPLNAEQLRAVQHQGRPLLIIAGPGAGKTLTLTHRIAYLIRHRNIPPENILAVTFTNKAAREMRDRLKSLIGGDDCTLPLTETFHSLCFQILKEESNEEYSIVDEDERKAFLAEAIRQVEQKGIAVHLKPDVLSDNITAAKQNILLPQDSLESVAEKTDLPLLSAVYECYQALLAQELRYDYEDLILNVVRLLESNNEIRQNYQNRFRYVFADEYQDLNQGQYRIVKALSPSHSEICVIGDPDQSIYGFRGSDVAYFQRFIDDYPQSEVIRLSKNYRSTETILEASHQVIKDHSLNPSGMRVYSNIKGVKTLTILELATERAEAVAVGKAIESMVGGTGFHSIDFGKTDESGIKTDRGFSDFAVLYRTHAQSQVFSEIFESAGIPYQIANRAHIYGRKGIAELLSFLKIAEGIGIFNDFQKIAALPDSGVSKKTCDVFKAWFYQNKFTLNQALSNVKRIPVPEMDSEKQRKLCSFADTIFEYKKNIAEKSVAEKLIFLFENTSLSPMIRENRKTEEAFQSLLSTAKAFGANLSDFFETVALQNNDADVYEIKAEKVTLMTLHAAKGLEFPVVFIVGCENDFIPFKRPESASRSNDSRREREIDVEEERRLFYVGMTRAKDRLILTHVKKRTIFGKSIEREISPFVSDIEARLISLETSQAKKRRKESQVQLDLFNSPCTVEKK
ncbi:MAG: hypothetical protein BWK80_23390 [Desulfobacteraceae bacterium IS3]|nr:MAG: hypothetical protein BWK80_23390 [Desulfobacteraceae bacterium IS3]